MPGEKGFDTVSELSLHPISKPQTAGREQREPGQRTDDAPERGAEEMSYSELSTLPWREEERKQDAGDGMYPGITGEEGNGESRDVLKGRSQRESDRGRKAKWRESMPEGERWRDDDVETGAGDKDDGMLADDEGGEEDEDQDAENWIPEKGAQVFTPQVNIVRPSYKEPLRGTADSDDPEELLLEPLSAGQQYPEWTEGDDNCTYLCDRLCGDRLKLGLSVAVAAVAFPLLVWGGYALLPFDAPVLESTPLRVVYTLRCSFFAIIPIFLGVVVQGAARLRYGVTSPLYQAKAESREVSVHWHYVNESLGLFLFYFLQLAVMATYISQDLLKLVPLLTIIFAFGRLIYWLCLGLGSSVRGLGFGFSFLPILIMLGVNLYYVCSSLEQDSIFDVGPPTTAPPPAPRWWG